MSARARVIFRGKRRPRRGLQPNFRVVSRTRGTCRNNEQRNVQSSRTKCERLLLVRADTALSCFPAQQRCGFRARNRRRPPQIILNLTRIVSEARDRQHSVLVALHYRLVHPVCVVVHRQKLCSREYSLVVAVALGSHAIQLCSPWLRIFVVKIPRKVDILPTYSARSSPPVHRCPRCI